jgi:hypothetical protein
LRIADREDGIGTDTGDGPAPNPPGDLVTLAGHRDHIASGSRNRSATATTTTPIDVLPK